jgi:hypothetical protein
VLTELKNRSLADICIAVYDGLIGLPRDQQRLEPRHRSGVHSAH